MRDPEFKQAETDRDLARAINESIKDSKDTLVVDAGTYKVVAKGMTKVEHFSLEILKSIISQQGRDMSSPSLLEAIRISVKLADYLANEVASYGEAK